MISPFLIPIDRFDNPDYINARLANLEADAGGAVRSALNYLYLTHGPINLPRDRLKKAEPYLEPRERIVIRWLYTRTNGSERKRYGAAALRCARAQRYRCEHCGFADVRVLNLDHVKGRANLDLFACLCANCHCLKSREYDWHGTGIKGQAS